MTFDELKRAHPRWHMWQGVAGLLSASRRKQSPPLVKRDETVEGLREQVEAETSWRDEHWG